MYSPLVGQFAQRDPLGYAAGDDNLYRYCESAPTDATDPSGLEEAKPFDNWERIYHLQAAIQMNNMTAVPNVVKKYTADDCCGIKGFSVTFDVQKAYTGKYFATTMVDGKQVSSWYYGAYLKFSASVNEKCPSFEKIRVIQAFRYVTYDPKQGHYVGRSKDYLLTHHYLNEFQATSLAGLGDSSAKEPGWFIDRTGVTDASKVTREGIYYDSDPNLPAGTVDIPSATTGTVATPITYHDAPGVFLSDTETGVDIDTTLIGIPKDKDAQKTYLARFTWGFYVDKDSKVHLLDISAHCGASKAVDAALGRWIKLLPPKNP